MGDFSSKESEKNKELREAANYYRRSSEKHRRELKTQMKVFMVTGIVVLSIVTIAMAIYAWFATNTSVTATGMHSSALDFNVDPMDYLVYKHDIPNNKYVSYNYNDYIGEGSGSPKIAMNTYDVMWEKSEDTAIILRVPIKSKAIIGAAASNYTKVRCMIGCSSSAVWKDVTAPDDDRRYLSSVMQLKCSIFPNIDKGKPASGKEAEYYYTNAKAGFDEVTANTFVEIDASGTPGYKASREMYHDFNITDFEIVNDVAYVYIEIDYAPELIKKYFKIEGSYYGIDRSINIDQFYQDLLYINFEIF